MEIRDTRNGSWYWVNVAVNACKHITHADKCVYGALASFGGCKDIHPSFTLIAERSNVLERSAMRSVKRLAEVGLISIEKGGGRGNANTYILLKCPKGCKECTVLEKGDRKNTVFSRQERVTEKTRKGDRNSTPIDKELDKELDTPEQSSEGAIIPPMIYLFKELNPSYRLFFNRPPQRAAAARLLELHNLTWWEQFIPKYKAQLETDRYCPRATTPIQMEEKIGNIELYAKSKKAESLKARSNVII